MKLKLVFIFLVLSQLVYCQADSTDDDLPYTFPMIIRYENNKAALNHINRLRLSNLAEYMNTHPDFHILIEGHVCCNPPNAKRVSKKRAKFVYKFLRKLDVSSEQMKFIGRSFEEPIILKEKNEDDKNLNRRVVIKIVQ